MSNSMNARARSAKKYAWVAHGPGTELTGCVVVLASCWSRPRWCEQTLMMESILWFVQREESKSLGQLAVSCEFWWTGLVESNRNNSLKGTSAVWN
jgi:hypothetical protein